MMILLDGFPHTLTNPTEARAFFLGQVFNRRQSRTGCISCPLHDKHHAEGWARSKKSSRASGVSEKGLGIIAAQKLRLIHSGVRLRLQLPQKLPENNWDVAACGLPINHEDLTAPY
jgi:hypothetical protein